MICQQRVSFEDKDTVLKSKVITIDIFNAYNDELNKACENSIRDMYIEGDTITMKLPSGKLIQKKITVGPTYIV